MTPAAVAKKVSAELPAPAERHDSRRRSGARSRAASQGVNARCAMSRLRDRAEPSSELAIRGNQWSEPICGRTVQHYLVGAGAAVVEQALRHRLRGAAGGSLLQPLRRQQADRLFYALAQFLVGTLLSLDVHKSRISQQSFQRQRIPTVHCNQLPPQI